MIDPEKLQRLHRLVDTFLEENTKLNLSALRTEELCWTGNVLDSLPLLSLPIISGADTLLDIGTGGGFPLLPLAICLPHTHLTGLDATQKKIEAVKRIARAMELTNVDAIAGRAEELGHDPHYREQFDIVTSRAVAPINVLLEYCSPFVKPRGHIVLWKSLHAEEELKDSLLARAELSSHLVEQHEYDLDTMASEHPWNGTSAVDRPWGKRQLLVFEKAASLAKKYPRGVGEPKKNPLK